MSKPGKLYSIVRSYGLRGLLIPKRLYPDLVSSRSLEELVEKLRPTLYSECLKQLPKPITSLSLEKALKSCAIEDEYKLLRALPKPGALEEYFSRHLYRNLKHVLKGKALGMGAEEVAAALCLRAEELLRIRDLVVKALAEESLEEAVEALRDTPLHREAEAAAELYAREEDPLAIDVALDAAFYKRLMRGLEKTPRADRRSLRRLIAPEIDGYLVSAVLRSMGWELTPAEARRFLLEEGVELSKNHVERMLQAESPKEVLKVLEPTGYARALTGLSAESPMGLAAEVEERFREVQVERSRKAFMRDVFKLSVIYAVVRLREEEVRNLTAIAFGIENSLSPNVIMDSLSEVV